MEIVHEVPDLKARLRKMRRVALVPTMGALHRGHLSLVDIARNHAEDVVATVFVNPKQFGPEEDLKAYPRTLDEDAEALMEAGCSLLFAPSSVAMYPPDFDVQVRLPNISSGLCGNHRPGHFDGVATVVLKLLTMIRPEVAVFGEKDFQQLCLIRRLVSNLEIETRILGGPLIRDEDGLALSSRNAYLGTEGRARALSLSQGLRAADQLYAAGERSAKVLVGAAAEPMARAQVEPEYLELRRYRDLEPLERADEPCVLLVAARIGSTRLIDNHILRRP